MFQIDLVIDSTWEKVDLNIKYQNANATLDTSLSAINGKRKFVGSVANSLDPKSTDFVFITATCAHLQKSKISSSDGDANMPGWNFTLQGFVFTVLNADIAARIASDNNMDRDPEKGFRDLSSRIAQKFVSVIELPALTGKGGLQGHNQFGNGEMMIQPTLGIDGKTVNLNFQFECGGKKLDTESSVYNGSVKFIGKIPDVKNPTSTNFIFIKCSFPVIPVSPYTKIRPSK
ncbi:MAG: hypothetical protein ABIP97_07795 [Chthoniobacterales bacterium]